MPKGIYKRSSNIGEKISKSLKGKPRPYQRGSKHGMWKGDNLTYIGIHSWNNENYPKSGNCVQCSKKAKTEWSLIHGKEHARGIENYRELCLSCYRKYDYEGRDPWNKGNVAVYKKICENCRLEFNGKKKTSRFCSGSCSGKWRFSQGLTKIIPGSNNFNRLALQEKK